MADVLLLNSHTVMLHFRITL